MEQPATGDHQRRRIVVELAEAVGGLRYEEPVVAAVAGDGPKSFERLHSSVRYRSAANVVRARTGANASSS